MPLTDNLIAYWKMDEASGDALDSLGSNNLTDNNTVGAGTGKVNGARDFEDTNTEWFNHGDNSALSTGDIDFTVAFWVKFESLSTNKDMVSKWVNAGWEFLHYYDVGSSRFVFYVVSSGGGTFTPVSANNFGAASTGTWYFVVGWHDSVNNQIGISINDGTPNTAAHSAGVADTATDFYIGRTGDTTDSYMDGLIDEVGFWKRVLTSTERTQLYNGGAGLTYPFTMGILRQMMQRL
jgi:hypothetical protein